MKSTISISLAVTTLILLIGCSAGRMQTVEVPGAGEEVRIFEVFGMDCPGCHGGLEKLVNKVPGVKTSKANWEKQQLQVILAAGADVTDEDIFAAIKQANFTAGKRLR